MCPLTDSPLSSFCSDETMRTHLATFPTTAVSALLTLTLVGLGIAGIGTAALVLQHENYKTLGALIDADLAELKKSISHLESSLISLAEVVLQNHQG